jgi:hypothetical protein
MSGEFEAAGAMATAGLVAGAIEGREASEAGDGACLNCGAELAGAYCSQCGQAACAHRSLGHMLQELLHSFFHFDTKVWRTLPMMVFRPGTLTRDYVYGKRARYVSPLALFLLAVFFMFAVFAFSGGPPVNVTESGTVAEAQANLDETRQQLATAEAELNAALQQPGADQSGLAIRLAGQAVDLAQAAVERQEQALRRAQAREAAAASRQGAAPGAEDAPADAAAPPTATDGAIQIDTDDNTLTWQEAARQIAESDDFVVIQGWDSFNESARERLRNPELAAYKIQEAASKFSFLLVPISLPFIALLFLWKRGVTLYDHVVFSLYALSFVSLMFVAIVVLSRVDWMAWFTPTAVLVGLPVHTFFHLKGAYALGWWSALWRSFFLLIFASVALTIFLIAILILGLAG